MVSTEQHSRIRSIKAYLIIVLLALVCLANFLAVLQGYQSSLKSTQKLLDKELAEQAALVTRLLDNNGVIASNLFSQEQLFQIWDKNQQLQYYAANAAVKPLLADRLGYHFVSHGGVRWRVLIDELPSGQRILVGQHFDNYIKVLEDLLLIVIVPIVWVVPILALVVGLIVRFGLAPLKHLAGQLGSRRVTDFSCLEVDKYPRELMTVVNSINQMLERLAAAFEREQRFASDAAHELRTPLTTIVVGLHNLKEELNQTLNDKAVTAAETIHSLEDSAANMSHTIEQLLSLCKLTPETMAVSTEKVDLLALIKNQIVSAYDQLNKKHQTIELSGDALQIPVDVFAISTLIRNLIDNASKYTPANGNIQISLTRHDADYAELCVEDSGPGIGEEDYDRVFSRFYRVGADRHASMVSGSGLGLSIVKHVVELHQGHIGLGQSPHLGGLKVCVLLPLEQGAKQ